jgi:hypothetical protein
MTAITRSIASDCLVMALREGADQALADFPEMEPFRDELEELVAIDESIDEIEARLRRVRAHQVETEQALYLAACGEDQ